MSFLEFLKSKNDKVIIFNIDDITMLSKKHLTEIGRSNPNFPTEKLSIILWRLTLKVLSCETRSKAANDVVRIPTGLNFFECEECKQYLSNTLLNVMKFLDLGFFAERWKIVQKCLTLIKRKNQESHNSKVEIAMLFYSEYEGIAHLMFSNLAWKTCFGNLHRLGLKTINTVKCIRKMYGECDYGLVSSETDILDSAGKLGLTKLEVKNNKDFYDLYDQLKEAWFPDEQKDMKPSVSQQTDAQQEKMHGENLEKRISNKNPEQQTKASSPLQVQEYSSRKRTSCQSPVDHQNVTKTRKIVTNTREGKDRLLKSAETVGKQIQENQMQLGTRAKPVQNQVQEKPKQQKRVTNKPGFIYRLCPHSAARAQVIRQKIRWNEKCKMARQNIAQDSKVANSLQSS